MADCIDDTDCGLVQICSNGVCLIPREEPVPVVFDFEEVALSLEGRKVVADVARRWVALSGSVSGVTVGVRCGHGYRLDGDHASVMRDARRFAAVVAVLEAGGVLEGQIAQADERVLELEAVRDLGACVAKFVWP